MQQHQVLTNCPTFPQVVSVAHSSLNFDGQVLEEGKELLVVIVKDNRQKGFFIRMVDPEVGGAVGLGGYGLYYMALVLFLQKKCVVGEKKITKTFQYDMPGDLVVTYLSEVRRWLTFLNWQY